MALEHFLELLGGRSQGFLALRQTVPEKLKDPVHDFAARAEAVFQPDSIPFKLSQLTEVL